MTDVPHFKIPFEFRGAKVAEVEQDDPAEIEQSVMAALGTVRGSYPESPEFGLTEQVFEERKANLATIERDIRRSEPRADYIIETLDSEDWLTSRVGIEIIPNGGNNV